MQENVQQSVTRVVLEAGKEILKIYSEDFAVHTKEDNSPLTEADYRPHRKMGYLFQEKIIIGYSGSLCHAADVICRSAGSLVVNMDNGLPLTYNKKDLHNPSFLVLQTLHAIPPWQEN